MVWFTIKVVLALLWGLPFAAVACLLCLSIVGMPLAPVAMGIGSVPLAYVVNKEFNKRYAE